MFKVNLIETARYYQIQARVNFFFVLVFFVPSFFINYDNLILTLTFIVLALTVGLWLFFYAKKHRKKIGKKVLVLTKEDLIIQDLQGKELEKYKLSDYQIYSPSHLRFSANPGFGISTKRAFGLAIPYFFILKNEKLTRNTFFEIESEYAAKNLEKLFDFWKEKDLDFHHISEKEAKMMMSN